MNVGIEPMTPANDSTFMAYENIGIEPPSETVIVRQPRGWGVLPKGPETIIIFDDQSDGTAYSYENITT